MSKARFPRSADRALQQKGHNRVRGRSSVKPSPRLSGSRRRLSDKVERTGGRVNAAVAATAAIISAAAAIWAVIVSGNSVEATRDQTRITAQGHVHEQYAKAIDQLGQSGPEMVNARIGAIFALERIMRDSVVEHTMVLDLLSRFVRTNAPKASAPDLPLLMPPPIGAVPAPPGDIQAALTVIGRRNAVHDRGEIDLSSTNLTGANLVGAKLARVRLVESDMTGAYLANANLTDAVLQRTDLRSANLTGAELAGADLMLTDLTGATVFRANMTRGVLLGANLKRTDLIHATLVDADLRSANLVDANLRGANLGGARGLTSGQLGCTLTDSATRLPEGVEPPKRRAHPCPSLGE